MTEAEVQGLIDSALALHGLPLTPAQVTAMLAERSSYAERTRELDTLLTFDDAPSDFRRALAEIAAGAEWPDVG